MARKNNPEELIQIYFPFVLPHIAINDFWGTKQGQDVDCPITHDEVPYKPAQEMFTVRKGLTATEEKLEDQKLQLVDKKKQLDLQWGVLESKEEELRAMFMQFNKFISDNTEKRERALKKIRKERALRSTRIADIVAKRKDILRLRNIYKEMNDNLDKHYVYEKFILDIIDRRPDQFTVAEDVIRRFENLAENKEELGTRQQQTLNDFQDSKRKYVALVEHSQIELIKLYNVISQLRRRIGESKRRTATWEMIVTNIQHTIEKNEAEIIVCKGTVQRLVGLMCSRSDLVADMRESSTFDQLLFIKKVLGDLQTIRGKVVKVCAQHRASIMFDGNLKRLSAKPAEPETNSKNAKKTDNKTEANVEVNNLPHPTPTTPKRKSITHKNDSLTKVAKTKASEEQKNVAVPVEEKKPAETEKKQDDDTISGKSSKRVSVDLNPKIQK